MQEIAKLYETAPLPYEYVHVPTPDEPENVPKHQIRYYVNKVITNLTRSAFKHAGFVPTSSPRIWNASWGRQYQERDYQKCQNWQKINHYAGAFLMGRKDNLNARMKELAARGEGLADFYPQSFLLPEDQDALNKAWKSKKLWIVKPSASSRGRGIHIVNSEVDQVPTTAGIVQYYIEHPLLITQRKFDIRLYALITSCDPLRIYMHKAGLARFCTHKYNLDGDYNDTHMHLTNFSLNKDDESFNRCDTGIESVEDSKWSFPFFINHLKQNGYDTDLIMSRLEHVTISTVIAGFQAIRKHHQKLIPHRHTSYEMYGIDIMFDENLCPHLIEINISPSMSGMDSKLDNDIKFPLMLDLLRMARIIDCDCTAKYPCPGVDMIDDAWRESTGEVRQEEVMEMKKNGWENPVFGDIQMIRDYIEEQSILGGFRRVFPKRKTMDTFIPCFEKLSYFDTMFQQWIRMPTSERLRVIKDNFPSYATQLEGICQDAATFVSN